MTWGVEEVNCITYQLHCEISPRATSFVDLMIFSSIACYRYFSHLNSMVACLTRKRSFALLTQFCSWERCLNWKWSKIAFDSSSKYWFLSSRAESFFLLLASFEFAGEQWRTDDENLCIDENLIKITLSRDKQGRRAKPNIYSAGKIRRHGICFCVKNIMQFERFSTTFSIPLLFFYCALSCRMSTVVVRSIYGACESMFFSLDDDFLLSNAVWNSDFSSSSLARSTKLGTLSGW